MSKDCIFCKIANKEISSKRIHENDNFFSIFDLNPKVEGHFLVISKKHFENIFEMPSSLGSEFLDCVKKTAMKIMKEQKSEGMNVVVNTMESAGQVVKHFHAHILPRKKGDGFKAGV